MLVLVAVEPSSGDSLYVHCTAEYRRPNVSVGRPSPATDGLADDTTTFFS